MRQKPSYTDKLNVLIKSKFTNIYLQLLDQKGGAISYEYRFVLEKEGYVAIFTSRIISCGISCTIG